MEASRPPQRKACDLCYRRKIKCDGQQPRCSTCAMYKSDCTYKAASRKAPSRKQAALQRQSRECDLQARVKTLEGQLSTVLEAVERLERNQGALNMTTPACSEDTSALVNPTSAFPNLPSFEESMPIVERFLATFNSVFPLFHPATVLVTVKNWYRNPQSRNTVTWAVINVVLALAFHTSSPSDSASNANTAMHVNNAQSVLTEIIMRETDLANVQVLLGLVMVFWATEEMGPALILVGTALRLAHKLGLHSRKSSELCSPALALQRNRVFWMAYILDRDISLQSRVAPIQLDSDIDLDLPPFEAEDDLEGFIFSGDGHIKMNYFRARVELARIQGKVYDCVYSTSAQNRSSEERTQKAACIVHELDDWSSRIPFAFQATTLSRSCISGLSRYFCILYSTRLSCQTQLSFASASDSFHYSEWIGRWQDYGGKIAAGQIESHSPVPHGWQAITDACREYMRLFQTVTLMDTFFIRMTLCAHNSSLTCLIANMVFETHHHAIKSDKEMAKTAMKTLEVMAKQTGGKDFRNIREALERLYLYADMISSRNDTLRQISSRLSFWDRDPRMTFDKDEEHQHLENDVLIPSADLYWTMLSDERL